MTGKDPLGISTEALKDSVVFFFCVFFFANLTVTSYKFLVSLTRILLTERNKKNGTRT